MFILLAKLFIILFMLVGVAAMILSAGIVLAFVIAIPNLILDTVGLELYGNVHTVVYSIILIPTLVLAASPYYMVYIESCKLLKMVFKK